MIIQNMPKETNTISISRGCSALGVSRSGYNKWIRQDQTHYLDPEEMKLKNEIQTIAIEFSRYGYRRITIELHRRGFEVNHKVVYEPETRLGRACPGMACHTRRLKSDTSLYAVST